MPEQAMVIITLAFGALIFFMGAWGLLGPRSIVRFIESWSSQGGLWLAVLMRLAFGAVLWFSAPLSRTPELFEGLGSLVVLSGVVLPLFGYTRFHGFIEWWAKLPIALLRLWCLVAVAFGVFVIWSVARPMCPRTELSTVPRHNSAGALSPTR